MLKGHQQQRNNTNYKHVEQLLKGTGTLNNTNYKHVEQLLKGTGTPKNTIE
jgi:hypothetical protein